MDTIAKDQRAAHDEAVAQNEKAATMVATEHECRKAKEQALDAALIRRVETAALQTRKFKEFAEVITSLEVENAKLTEAARANDGTIAGQPGLQKLRQTGLGCKVRPFLAAAPFVHCAAITTEPAPLLAVFCDLSLACGT